MNEAADQLEGTSVLDNLQITTSRSTGGNPRTSQPQPFSRYFLNMLDRQQIEAKRENKHVKDHNERDYEQTKQCSSTSFFKSRQ